MIQDEFNRLRLKLIAISLAFSFIPLFSLGLGLYDKFFDTYTDKVHGNLRNLVDNKKVTIDMIAGGAADYLLKPCPTDELEGAIRAVYDRKQATRPR